MRLAECMRVEVRLAPRILKEGELGSVTEQFSQETTLLRASKIEQGGELNAEARGMIYPARLRLLVYKGVQALPGDGVWVEESLYRILSIERWSAHEEWLCEAIQ